MLPQIREEIQAYARAVWNKEVRCDLERCPRCRRGTEEFCLHDRRERTFLIVIERLVEKVVSALTRWRCRLCKQTFTLYPAFALPRKRYVRQKVFDLAQRYVDDEHQSYRKAVKVSGMPVFYESRHGAIDDRVLSHSTLYRWMGLFSSLSRTRLEVLRRIRGKSPTSEVLRKAVQVPPWKYRSPRRKRVLQNCLRLLRAEQEYRSLFGVSVFPRLATVCSWG